MARRILMLVLIVSVVLLGLPNIAMAGGASGDGMAGQAMSGDCVCPPGHEMPAPDQGSDECAPTLGCMMQCGVAPMAVPMHLPASPHALPAYRVMAGNISAPRPSSVAPPFRPPSL